MHLQQGSLKFCAMRDAEKYGAAAVRELQEKWRIRKRNYRPGKKTNVGDPNPSGNVISRKG